MHTLLEDGDARGAQLGMQLMAAQVRGGWGGHMHTLLEDGDPHGAQLGMQLMAAQVRGENRVRCG